jgi:hypothetical protein
MLSVDRQRCVSVVGALEGVAERLDVRSTVRCQQTGDVFEPDHLEGPSFGSRDLDQFP